MNFNNDLELLDDFSSMRNLKKISSKAYLTSINLYSNFNNSSFVDLIQEAETEENQLIRWKDRRLKKRLLSFRNFMTHNYHKNYVRTSLSRVITIYRHYGIEVHDLPPQSSKNFNEVAPITFTDLPSKSMLKKAFTLSNPLMKALILFMISSGCARQETLDLTVKDFIDATREYHDSANISDVLNILESENNIIPTFKLKRKKTNKFYFTFCSPEATYEIISYLKTRKSLKPSDKLFKIHHATLTRNFIKINNKLKLGKAGLYNRFRSHMLRKFHASALKNDGMHIEDINSLQGKSKNRVDEAYFFDNPSKLREVYQNHVNSVTINPNYFINPKRYNTLVKSIKIENT